MSFKLYELTEQYQHLLNLIDEHETDSPALIDTLEAIDGAIEDKLDNIAKLVRTLEAESEAFKKEELRFQTKRKVRENNTKRLKAYAQEALEATGRKKVEGATFTLALQKNPPSVEVLDEKLIPPTYFIPQDPTLDKKSLLAQLKAGQSIAGVDMKQTESLRIR